MKTKYLLLLTLFFASMALNCIAQFTSVMDLPQKYLYPVETNKISYPIKKVCSDTAWYVFSDRANNKVYQDASEYSKILFEADFLDTLAVIEIKGSWFKVTWAENVFQFRGNKILPGSTLGWIKFDNLLLSSHCLIAQNTEQFRKGVILNTFSNKTIPEKYIFYYEEPNTSSLAINDTADSFQIRYIYKKDSINISNKKDGNNYEYYYLVGNNCFLNKRFYSNYNENHKISVGWISGNQFIPWTTNVAWELNWHPDAVKKRIWIDKKDGLEKGNIIFDTRDATNNYGNIYPQWFYSLQKRTVIETDVIYETRKNGISNRFPLLYDTNPTCSPYSAKRVGVVLEVSFKNDIINLERWNVEERESFRKEIVKVEEGQKKINVIFVVDGSKSTIKYNNQIAKSIEESIDKMKNDENKVDYSINVGAVIYRDEAEDEKCDVFNEGKMISIKITDKKNDTDTSEITKLISSFERWIDDNWIDEKNKKDKDFPEALYYGITVALDSFELKIEESNFIVLIGDAADHRDKERTTTFVSESDLIDSLSKYNVNILAYQVPYSDKHNTHTDFITQIERIIKETDTRVYNKIFPIPSIRSEYTITHGELEYNKDIIMLKKNCLLKSRILKLGKHKTDSIKKILIDDISTNITNPVYLSINSKIQEIAAIFMEKYHYEPSEASNAAIIIFEWIKNTPQNESIKEKIPVPQKYIYFEGYTTFINRARDSVTPMFQPVLLFEEKQLHKFYNQLKRLDRDFNTIDEMKEEVGNAVIEMINCFVSDYKGSYRSEPIGSMLFCLSMFEIKEKYSSWTINDIQEKKPIIPFSDIEEMRNDLIITSNILDQIISLGNNYPAKILYSTKDKINRVYWWIPTDIFPHKPKNDDVKKVWF